jgi:hypothetical protein
VTESGTRAAGREGAVLRRLRRDGYLIFTDSRWPSVVTLVAGAPVRGRWFAHPAAHEIYRIGELLERDPALLDVPLLERKSTLVHRRLWPAVLAVSTSRQPWQLDGLSAAERELLRRVERDGSLYAGEQSGLPMARGRSRGDVARGLERRLLVHGTSVHTTSGRHAKLLENWNHWRDRQGVLGRLLSVAQARAELEATVHRALGPEGPWPRLPWERVRPRGGPTSARRNRPGRS